MGRIIAIDYGKKRTGLAWTDPLQLFASGIGSFDTPFIKKKLVELFEQETIDEIVLGYPTRFDGSDTHATPLVREFNRLLNKWFPDTPVHLWDETFTSKMAMDSMIRAGVKKKKRRDKHLINQVSATLILQQYLVNRSI